MLCWFVCMQGPDTYFQMAEAANKFYDATPAHVKTVLAEVEAITGRKYGLFDYVGHPQVRTHACTGLQHGLTLWLALRLVAQRQRMSQ